jgi:carbon-monoxide dehydrogenase small subunit
MVLSAYALLQKNQRPSRTEVRQAIKGNLCRCTGYQQIVDAVMHAAQVMYPDA